MWGRKPEDPKKSKMFYSFLCPIEHEVFEDPVIAADGYTYERAAIERWIRQEEKSRRTPRSPMTNEDLLHTMLTPNFAIKQAIEEMNIKQTPETKDTKTRSCWNSCEGDDRAPSCIKRGRVC